MTKRFGGAASLCLTWLFLFATPAMSQQSRCADCHFSRPEAPAPDHLADWDRSAGEERFNAHSPRGRVPEPAPVLFEELPAEYASKAVADHITQH